MKVAAIAAQKLQKPALRKRASASLRNYLEWEHEILIRVVIMTQGPEYDG